ncbi:hypothetical protein GJ496_004509 [Pomphorhynchus laevis]|nr:hypothetical protein GJ496_004509 [Pomphorhynchus laevis]
MCSEYIDINLLLMSVDSCTDEDRSSVHVNFNDRIRQASEKYARFLQPSLSKRCRPLEPSLRPIVLMTNILRQLLLNQTSYTTSSEQSLQVQSTSLLNDQQQNCKNEVGSISTTIEESCSKGSDFNNDVEMDYDENSTNAPLQTASETCQLSDVRSASNKKFFAKQDPNSTNKSRQINIQSSLTTGTEESFRESISQRLRSRRKLKSQK